LKKNGREKNIYALYRTIEVSWAGEAAEGCQLVGETLIVTYTRQMFINAKYVIYMTLSTLNTCSNTN